MIIEKQQLPDNNTQSPMNQSIRREDLRSFWEKKSRGFFRTSEEASTCAGKLNELTKDDFPRRIYQLGWVNGKFYVEPRYAANKWL